MACCTSPHDSERQRHRVIRTWTTIQYLLWGAGVALMVALIWWPTIGLHALWDVLIPAAPALVVFAPGLWRNICPLGSTSQVGRRLAGVRGWQLTPTWQARMGLLGVIILLAVVPLRHPWFNLGGTATLLLLLIAGLLALGAGFLFAGKSGWCTGLCPVHAVERLYGTRSAVTVTSAHCKSCVRCTVPCPDTAPGLRHGQGQTSLARQATHFIIVGGFPGFVWGWFQVPDGTTVFDPSVWLWPFGSMCVTMVIWVLLRAALPRSDARRIDALFAALAVSCYYWFRIPALVGYGVFPGDGMLIDIHQSIPFSIINVTRVLLAVLFVWWLVIRRAVPRPWMYTPPRMDEAHAAMPISIGVTA